MKNVFKKIMCLFISAIVVATMAVPAVAAEDPQNQVFDESYLTNEYINSCSLETLYELSHIAEEQQHVNAIFDELLERVSEQQKADNNSQRSTPTATTNLIDNYVSVTSANVTTAHVLTIKINVKSNIPSTSYFNFELGYEYPTACRTEGTMVSLAGRSKGNHTITINTKGLVSGIYISVDIIARDYKEHKHFKTLFDRPYATHTAYQTITQTDVTVNKVTAAIPSVILFFTPTKNLDALGKVTIKIAEALSIAVALDAQTPDMAVGQYYKTTTTYTTDFKCVVKVQIYASKASYNAGASPIHTSNATINIPH